MLEEAQLLHSERFKREFNRSGYRNGAGFSGKGMLPQPADDKMKTEDKTLWSDQVKSLKAHRQARGECFKCGEKFQPGHRCAKNVPKFHTAQQLEQPPRKQSGYKRQYVASKCWCSWTQGAQAALYPNKQLIV